MMYRIIQHLDAPRRYFAFTIDEVCVAGLALLLVAISSHKIVVVLLSGLLITVLRTLKQGKGPKQLWIIVYWYLPSFVSTWILKNLPKAYLRVWQV